MCHKVKGGVVGVNPALLDEEDSFDGIEDVSSRLSKNGWLL